MALPALIVVKNPSARNAMQFLRVTMLPAIARTSYATARRMHSSTATLTRRSSLVATAAAAASAGALMYANGSAEAAPAEAAREGYIAPEFAKVAGLSFDAWRSSLRESMPITCERDIEGDLRKFVGERLDKQLMWQTLKDGERGIRRIAMWQQETEPKDENLGKVRLLALVELGDALNGHVGVVHGGFSAALLDDLLGQTTMQEARKRGISGAPLTASLDLKYKHPVMANATYLVRTQVETLEPREGRGPPSWNVRLTATIYDAAGHVCVEAKSRYVLKTFK